MDANSQYELYLIKQELQNITNELDTISLGVRRDFTGIGNEKCASSLTTAANHYRNVKSQLDKMDLSALSDEYLAAHSPIQAMPTSINTEGPSPAKSRSSIPTQPKNSSKTVPASKESKISNPIKEIFQWLFK